MRGAINCLRDIFFAKYWSPQWRPYVMLSTDGVGGKVIKITKSPTCSPDVYLLPLEIRPFVDFILGYLKPPPPKKKSDLLMKNFDIFCGPQIWPPEITLLPSRIGPSHGELRYFVCTSDLATSNHPQPPP